MSYTKTITSHPTHSVVAAYRESLESFQDMLLCPIVMDPEHLPVSIKEMHFLGFNLMPIWCILIDVPSYPEVASQPSWISRYCHQHTPLCFY